MIPDRDALLEEVRAAAVDQGIPIDADDAVFLLALVDSLRAERDALRAAGERLMEVAYDRATVYRPQAFGPAQRCGHQMTALGYFWCDECRTTATDDALKAWMATAPPSDPT